METSDLVVGCAFIYIDPAFADIVKEQYHNKYCCPKVFLSHLFNKQMMNKLQVRDAYPPQKHHMNYIVPPQPPSLPVVPPPTEPNPSSPNSNSSSPSLVQQVPGVYPIPYYSIMPQNMIYPHGQMRQQVQRSHQCLVPKLSANKFLTMNLT